MWTRAQVANASHDGALDSELRLNYEDLPGVGGMGMISAMQNVDANDGERRVNTADDRPVHGPWNPGIQSQIPRELLHLSTIFRPENVFTSIAAVIDMQGLTGFSPAELVAFRPQRLALHELLIRVTADFAVPDGSRIGDLGINFREMASRLFERHLLPEMDAISAAYDRARFELRDAVDTALATVAPEQAPAARAKRWPGLRRFARLAGQRGAAAVPAGGGWGPGHIADCE